MSVFPQFATIWRRNLGVADDGGLPHIYHLWANSSKAERRTALQTAFNKQVESGLSASRITPLATKELYEMVVQGQLTSHLFEGKTSQNILALSAVAFRWGSVTQQSRHGHCALTKCSWGTPPQRWKSRTPFVPRKFLCLNPSTSWAHNLHARALCLTCSLVMPHLLLPWSAITASQSMQFGRVLEQVLWKVATADPAQGPLYLLKIDLFDGFYHVCLRAEDAPMLCVAFPVTPGEPLLTAILLVLPMGWTESPPYFCTTTETIVDLANLYSHSMWDPPSHPLEVPGAIAALWDGHLPIMVPLPDVQADRQPKSRGDAVASHPVTTTGTCSPLR